MSDRGSVDAVQVGRYPTRRMFRRLRAVAFGLMTLVLAGQALPGNGLGATDDCPCEEAEAAHADGEGTDGEGATETCPPDCDDCSCCGGATMVAALAPAISGVAPVGTSTPLAWFERAAPRGETSGVFRPPKA